MTDAIDYETTFTITVPPDRDGLTTQVQIIATWDVDGKGHYAKIGVWVPNADSVAEIRAAALAIAESNILPWLSSVRG